MCFRFDGEDALTQYRPDGCRVRRTGKAVAGVPRIQDEFGIDSPSNSSLLSAPMNSTLILVVGSRVGKVV